MMKRFALCLSALLLSHATAFAGKADVIDAKASKDANGTYTVTVTVKSNDTGWEKYADRWEVVAPDGTVLGVRVLAHPHDDEQPFTRDQSGIAIPADVKTVTIRAHDTVEGFGGKEFKLQIPQ